MRFYVRSLLLSIACCAGTALAQAQSTAPSSYPVKPVRLMLGPGPSSVADGLTRVMAAAMTELWGQQVLVDNRPGAGNTIAPAIVAKSPPDVTRCIAAAWAIRLRRHCTGSCPTTIFATSRSLPASD